MKKYFFVSKNNLWSNRLFARLLQNKKEGEQWFRFETSPNGEDLKKAQHTFSNPEYIFFFHHSQFIKEDLYNNFKCISFHTSNLLNGEGRGGSPIQNQILENITQTHVNAMKTCKEIDKGDIYLSQQITLQGNLNDIWSSIADVSYGMIQKITNENIIPSPQPTSKLEKIYKRNKNNVIPFKTENDLYKIYRFIQMLDGDGYENANVELGNFKLKFSRAQLNNGEILADVRIVKK